MWCKSVFPNFLCCTLLQLLVCSLSLVSPSAYFVHGGSLSYSRDVLYGLQYTNACCESTVSGIPMELTRCYYNNTEQKAFAKRRKRGKRGGVKQRLRRRPNRLPLPSIVLSNVRSLCNKLDELNALVKYDRALQDTNLFCFTESWLGDNVDDNSVVLEGFSIVRSDRSLDSNKTKGGGICCYVNKRWCSDITVYNKECTPDVELLSVSLRPYYLPREFGCIKVLVVYIPPDGNAVRAADYIAEQVNASSVRSPNSPVFVLGDFNHCRLNRVLPNYRQYVTCTTRGYKVALTLPIGTFSLNQRKT
ncbi:uncharacterized protein LOC117108636 [Anneissia japonica]|uniref:uncharacterized protein LOC117108636 n=1 Tax=Anneissia japonica TaxID=1529436 RepID=UPI001425B373|nr:uncharacterized protein LOC117108636 [Anneissia japonica]XP_033106728.1 uncharacterized protein LOC117108636 [Anneissia japonica]